MSVRSVAAEAGLSTGSLRYVFTTQAELVAFAMAALADRVTERLAALEPARTPLDAAEDVLAQFLPLDDERRREAEVWLAFVARAPVDPKLSPLAEPVDEALREMILAALRALGLTELEGAVEEVYALVDGLTLHAVLRPGRPAPETMRRILRTHLDPVST